MAKLQKPESNGYVNHTAVAHIWSGTCGHSLRSLGKFLIISNPIECTIITLDEKWRSLAATVLCMDGKKFEKLTFQVRLDLMKR